MAPYFFRPISKILRRIHKEFAVELPILRAHWKIIVLGIFFQYLHGVASHSAHFLHHPAPVLEDMGFNFIPEIGKDRAYLSEILWFSLFIPFSMWTFHPFFSNFKTFYTVVIWAKALMVLVICQFLRVLSFTSTQLPGPNYHCRVGSPTATLAPPKSIWDILSLNVLHGCGDLIFSSHMTFTITSVMSYTRHGSLRPVKFLGWLLLVIQSFLIVAARKHYTVDIVVAWYAVPLVYFFVDQKLMEMMGLKDYSERSPSFLLDDPSLPRSLADDKAAAAAHFSSSFSSEAKKPLIKSGGGGNSPPSLRLVQAGKTAVLTEVSSSNGAHAMDSGV